MLKDFPVRFDETEIMQWSKWEEERKVIEDTYETEAGTDQVDVVTVSPISQNCPYILRVVKRIGAHDKLMIRKIFHMAEPLSPCAAAAGVIQFYFSDIKNRSIPGSFHFIQAQWSLHIRPPFCHQVKNMLHNTVKLF